MPRRSVVPDGDDAHVKREGVKVKDEKVKTEKSNKGKGKARIEEQDEEDQHQDDEDAPEEEYDEEDDEQGRSPRGNKRRRVNGDGDALADPDADDDEQEQRAPRVTLPRGADGYIPGSIVRIKLENFVTYDAVEFECGPYLNMIVGPNGTGKSSIACAIALGLNFPPQILGRATELNSFVKNGTNEGYIEIELKGKDERQNLVIRRNLKATSKSSTFTLNGHSATGSEIKEKMADLNVQVGNLCSFLPQDKVSSFAAMSPQQLLRETERAAGDERLSRWHDTLIADGKVLFKLQSDIKIEEDTLKQLEERNRGIENDVKRYKERKTIEHAIALLNLLIPVAEYREIRAKFIEMKGVQRRSHARVKKLQQKNEPAHALLRKMEQTCKDAEKARDAMKKSTQDKFGKLSAKDKAVHALEKESGEITDQLVNLKREEKERGRQIQKLETEITDLKAELEKPPPANLPDENHIKELTRDLLADKNKLGEKIEDVNDECRKAIQEKQEASYKLDQAQRALKSLDNLDNQRLEGMLRWDKDTHDAIKWVREEKAKGAFRMEVFETPYMRLTVPNKKYVNAVESCFNAAQMRTFVAQCQQDIDHINHHINDSTAALGRRVRVTTWFRPTQEESLVPPPMTRDELKALGFDGYAIDYVDCPEEMKYFLRKELNLHRTAIALNGHAIDVGKAMDLVARPIPSHGHPGGANFINGSTVNMVSRSRYGKKAIGNMTRDFREARNLNAPTIDPTVRERCNNDIKEAQRHYDLWDEAHTKGKEKSAAIKDEERALKKRADEIAAARQAINDEQKRKVSADTKLQQRVRSLKALKAKPPPEAQRAKLTKRLKETNAARMERAKEYTDLVHSIIHEQEECTKVGLRYLQVAANKAALQELCERKDAKYQTAVREYTAANERFQEIKARSKVILERSRAMLDAADREVSDEYTSIENVRIQYEKDVEKAEEAGLPAPDSSHVELRTADQLQAELETQQTRLEMNMNTNPGVVEQYEHRKRLIEQHEKGLADKRKQEAKIMKDIKNARDNWQPALERLVKSIGDKFSASFERIGCAGEIRINENEDYEKWAIDILVKFRATEKLQLLTAHRQSGGERSFTTILYLMSLTEEARAPFSLVDEINQGMDQRAERVVHNSMVNVTCQPDSAQYFLITPKLLPDLNYHEKMKVLCVNNGEWLPEERGLGKMMSMIDTYVASRGGQGGASSH